MSATRTVLVLTSDPDGPVVRHRFGLFGDALREAGIVLEAGPWPKRADVRRHTLDRAGEVDAVVVSSRLLVSRDVRRLRDRARLLGFDYDDALPFRDSSRGATRSGTRTRRFGAIVRAADRVTAGNAYLAALAQGEGREALVLPTVVCVPDGPAPAERAAPVPVLGWIGALATLPYLEALADVFAALGSNGAEFHVRTIADVPPTLPPGVENDFVRWSPEGWPAALSAAHVGIAPLPDDPWTRGKCGLKVLQLYAVGRPVVASPVGVQVEQVVDGETGFLAADDDSFIEALGTLLTDDDMRRAMGAAAFAHVRRLWSVAAWREAVVTEMEALLAGERSAGAS